MRLYLKGDASERYTPSRQSLDRGRAPLAKPGLTVCWRARTSQTCTFEGALEAALSLTERPYSYPQMLAECLELEGETVEAMCTALPEITLSNAA
jgi:hypothetical protein